MADSIEMRPALLYSPRVRRMVGLLRADVEFMAWARQQAAGGGELLARAVVATLMVVWATAREVAPTGLFEGGALEEIDRLAGVPGFARAMQQAGWLQVRAEGVVLPHFEEHNPPGGAGKKRRRKQAAAAGGADEGFEEFWKCYPRKIEKAKARAVWRQLSPDAELRAKILAAIEAQKKSELWRREGGKFIVYPERWLERGRWEDETAGAVLEGTPARIARHRAEADARRAGDAGRAAPEELAKILQRRHERHQQIQADRVEEGRQT
jgi:hypothetical protein